jgi:peptidoglycan-N-acetylmuramic acid deacetylase
MRLVNKKNAAVSLLPFFLLAKKMMWRLFNCLTGSSATLVEDGFNPSFKQSQLKIKIINAVTLGGQLIGVSGLLVGTMGLQAADCGSQIQDRPLYFTFDTGHMGVAPLVAKILAKHEVLATFFLANEKTETQGSSLDEQWAPWWRERAQEGHQFGSHTWDHVYWIADLKDRRFKIRSTFGPQSGQTQIWTTEQYCAELQKPADRFKAMTGRSMSPIFRAPGGKTSPALIAAAKFCGWKHVPWTPAGFLGDELSSQTFPNKLLLNRALNTIKKGDILLAHLGIWSRQEPWAPAVLEPLIVGLKHKGFCFATLQQHPLYGR